MKRIIQKSSDGKETKLTVSNTDYIRRTYCLQFLKDPIFSEKLLSMKDQLPIEGQNLIDEISKLDEIYIDDEEQSITEELTK